MDPVGYFTKGNHVSNTLCLIKRDYRNFDEAASDQTTYFEKVELYFATNGVEEDGKVSTLLTLLEGKTYSQLKSLVAPNTPSSRTLEQIKTALSSHLNQKPKVIAERYRFNRRVQQERETITNWIAALKKLAETCAFGDLNTT